MSIFENIATAYALLENTTYHVFSKMFGYSFQQYSYNNIKQLKKKTINEKI